MLKRFGTVIIFSFVLFLSCVLEAQAGFGISPPYLKSDQLIPGTQYSQSISLLRSSAEDDLVANITVNAPDIESWISIDKGFTFDLPAGQLRVPMNVTIDVPADAPLGDYQGYLSVRISPKTKSGGGVAVALGARIDIDLTLTKDTFPDFKVLTIQIPDFEELTPPWSWRFFRWFFYRIEMNMKIENTGNVDTAPTKVTMEVYDLTEKNLLETLSDTSFKKIKAYQTGTINASFPTQLGEGQYWGKIKVYKGNEIVHANKIAFTVAAPGTLQNYNRQLGLWPWVLLSAVIVLAIICLLVLVKIKIWKYLITLLYWLAWPLRFLLGLFKKLLGAVREKFWSGMHARALNYEKQRHKNDNERK